MFSAQELTIFISTNKVWHLCYLSPTWRVLAARVSDPMVLPFDTVDAVAVAAVGRIIDKADPIHEGAYDAMRATTLTVDDDGVIAVVFDRPVNDMWADRQASSLN